MTAYPDESSLLDEAVRRLRTDRWIPVREFPVGLAAKAALSYSETKYAKTRKRFDPLRVDLLLVSRGTDRAEDDEIENCKEWPGKFGYKKYNEAAPEWEGCRDIVFRSEMGRLFKGRDVVVVECKLLKEGEKGDYGAHALFHALGQGLLYYELFTEDFDQGHGARTVATAALVNESYTIANRAFERLRERFRQCADVPPFSAKLWDRSFADRDFFR